MNFKCKYCQLRFEIEHFQEIVKVNNTQCYVTRKGVNHDLKAVFE